MASYLDKTGLQYFWDQIKTKFATLAFKTVRVTNNSTNTDIQADSTADMLTLIAGSNITLTPNATTDTITIAAASGAQPTSTTPKMDGTAAVGSESTYARGDHVHPTDTSRQAKITASGILKGNGSGGVTAATAGTDYMTPANVSSNYVPLSKSSAGSTVTITDNPSLSYSTFDITAASGSYSSKLDLYVDSDTGSQVAYLKAGSNTLRVSNTATKIKNVVTPSADGDAANKKYVDDSIGALDGGTIGTGSTTKTITSLSQSNGNVSATFSDIAFPVTSVNGQTGAVTTAEKFVITATAISGTEYYNLNKTYADIASAINQNKYVAIQDVDMTYPYTTTVSQGIVFGATLIATGEGGQLLAVTDGILVAQSGSSTLGMAVHSSIALPTMSDIPSASSTTPLMDGTADVGIQTYIYARADHVHPTDTSRQAVLVSGTNIKTINNTSLLGSGNIDISGGGSSTLFVTVTYANYAYTADTTYADMMSAVSAGKDIVLILVDSNQQKTWYYTMTYAPKTTTENFCFASEDELGTFKHLLVNNADAWWTADDISLLSYAKKASPTFTGTPKAPTASAGTNTTQIATTAFVKTAITNAIGSAISASY